MDKIREEFEEWMLKKIDSIPLHLSLVKYDGGNYINDFTQISWMAWCDSRAALCVELPETPEFNAEDEPEIAYEWAVNDLKDRLELAGVSFI